MELRVYPTSIDIISGSSERCVISLSIHGMMVSDTVVQRVNYQILSIPECASLSSPGKPALPFISRVIASDPQKRIQMSLESYEIITFLRIGSYGF